MNKFLNIGVAAFVSLAMTGASLAQQQSGVVGRGAPEDVSLGVSRAADGTLSLSATELKFAWGGYYRFNLMCPSDVVNESGLSFTAPDFLQNAHIRLVSVSDQGGNEINFHLQGLNLRMIDCEGLEMSARISFHPMRRGTFPFTLLDDTVNPPVELTGSLIVE